MIPLFTADEQPTMAEFNERISKANDDTNQMGNYHVWRRTSNGQVDYLVSIDPNAYQEGGPKPSGYTLGPVTSGSFGIGQDPITWSGEISVSDDGIVSLSGGTQSAPFAGNGGAQTAQGSLPGKFVLFQASHPPFNSNTIYFIPTDATFTYSGLDVYVNKYQTVTGYPAIPSDTVIEYVGQLGDRARVVTGSYVGTGTYGESNPNSIMFQSIPDIVFIVPSTGMTPVAIFLCKILDSTPKGYGFMTLGRNNDVDVDYNKASISGTTLSWSSARTSPGSGPENQLNLSGTTYYYTAIIQ